LLLVSDGVDAVLPGGVSSGVEVGGGGTEGGVSSILSLESGSGNVGGDELEELLSGEVAERVGLRGVGNPRSSAGVDGRGHLSGDGVSSLDGAGKSDDGSDDDQLEHRKIYLLL